MPEADRRATTESAGGASPATAAEADGGSDGAGGGGGDGRRLEGGAYEVIRTRLRARGDELRQRLDTLNEKRKATFGGIETKLLATERVTTGNHCVPRDMVQVGERFLFGYNVQLGLRSETAIADVFSAYDVQEHNFREVPVSLVLDDPGFLKDFRDLYKYYKETRFVKFSEIGPHLFMVFRVGKGVGDIKTFKWVMKAGGLEYIDNRSDHEYRFPPQHDFEWIRCTRDMHRYGEHPHISIEDRLFVETVGGDLTIKIEDNTASGEGIYAEPVENPDQTLDDAEIFYAIVGKLILLRVKPYQEQRPRYIVYSEKIQAARRIDSIGAACVLLPEDHGLIFPDGYYLQTGESKTFDHALEGMIFERRIASPNGEDFLYVFYNRDSGVYCLLTYNLIEQAVGTPMICHGFSLFENGHLVNFRGQEEPQKVHAIQVWRTPFVGADVELVQDRSSYLYKIGNRELVRCMAACQGVLNLIRREDTYADLYVDITKQTTDVLDAYFWLGEEDTANLKEPLAAIREAAGAAIDEFEKVVKLKKHADAETQRVAAAIVEIDRALKGATYETIEPFVKGLADLRQARGEVIALRDVRYTDPARLDAMEAEVQGKTDDLANRCVDFLLRPEALDPYRARVEAQSGRIDGLSKLTDAKELEAEVQGAGAELEMLIDVTSNLKIDDATQRTAILDGISTIFSTLNQVRSRLKTKARELASVEGKAEFASQMKLLDQAVVGYLDVCDTPEKAEDYLGKVMVQLEELEGKFADFDEYVEDLTAKREEVYNAFESRKLQLVEARNKKADAMLRSAERILKGIRTRAEGMDEIGAIHGYFAGDMMVDKVRDIIDQLETMGDSVKAGDIQAQLKTIREDAVRQLKDRKELYVDGQDVIQFGQHRFSVNTQALDLTVVRRDDGMGLHLTGTDFYEAIEDEAFLATRPVWSMDRLSENNQVYRGEYLAYQLFQGFGSAEVPPAAAIARMDEEAVRAVVQRFMGPRYAEGYVKGVHDVDGGKILHALAGMEASLGMLRYHTRARALATLLWATLPETDAKQHLAAKLRGFGAMRRAFETAGVQQAYIEELAGLARDFCAGGLFDPAWAEEAARYLFDRFSGDGRIAISPEAAAMLEGFEQHLQRLAAVQGLEAELTALRNDPAASISLLRDWLGAYATANDLDPAYIDEAAVLRHTGLFDRTLVASGTVVAELTGLVGGHDVIVQGAYRLHFNDFMAKLARFDREVVPAFRAYQETKSRMLEESREAMRLAEFMPRVMSSFVRNRLIDRVYLPLVGDNLAKQIGVVGANTRTDRMGLLLLISPPGYGKTTLMEYIANRLGIIFMKINGPAIGHGVTSIDPAEATNAAAREELKKLNLALEMGDNVMLYLDDIQHCNPELLQKFISLCDAQRKIEGVYKGRPRTYDLRGKKVCVVMAGNPYTESGEAFRIPDMLANRADTYNLGDVIGENAEYFELSYIENCLTSNAVLTRLASKSQADVLAMVQIAETGSRESVHLEGAYAAEELEEYVSVLKKLLRVRDIVLAVNQEYIRSAAMADAYRTEPAFKLQGSYRNMNRIAEKVLPVMNDEELEALVHDHYQNEAQTLTTGAEANLLKFKELTGRMTDEEAARWTDIKRTFKRNQSLQGMDESDKGAMVVAQLATFKEGLDQIRDSLAGGVQTMAASQAEAARVQSEALALQAKALSERQGPVTTAIAEETLTRLQGMLQALQPTRPDADAEAEAAAGAGKPTAVEASLARESLVQLARILHRLRKRDRQQADASAGDEGAGGASRAPVEVINKVQVPKEMFQVIQQQAELMQEWLDPILKQSSEQRDELRDLGGTLKHVVGTYHKLIRAIQQDNTD